VATEHEENQGSQSIIPASQLAALIRVEIDTQISTAKQYPRSLKAFKTKALEMATFSQEIAAGCFYSKPRAGKPIEGPSIRLAEICGSAWGNIRYGARVINDDGRIITAQGVCHDLESNVSATIENEKSVIGKNGKRFSEDMVVTTGNAACSIALRNAIFKVVPMAYVNEIYLQARKVAIGDAKTLAANRAVAVEHFQKMGVPVAHIFAAVGKAAIEDIGLDELAMLKGLATALRDGDTTVDEAFPDPAKAAEAANGTSRADTLKSKLAGTNGNGTKKPEPEAEKKPEAPTPPPKEPEKTGETLFAPAAEQKTAPPAAKDAVDPQILISEFEERIDSARKLSETAKINEDLVEAREQLGEKVYTRLSEGNDMRHMQIQGEKRDTAKPVQVKRK
jgi:hypothetical protein